MHRTDAQGSYGCDVLGPGSLDGAAQEGEVAIVEEDEVVIVENDEVAIIEEDEVVNLVDTCTNRRL